MKKKYPRTDDSELNDNWVEITVNGESIKARQGESLGFALYAAGYRMLHRTQRSGSPRGLFCGMGVCFDCLLRVNDRPSSRACMTPVELGMQVRIEVSKSSI
jgi:predicted molibdopterin-dependent oxidoreductase YjgC